LKKESLLPKEEYSLGYDNAGKPKSSNTQGLRNPVVPANGLSNVKRWERGLENYTLSSRNYSTGCTKNVIDRLSSLNIRSK
jgi:hypothetical protein